MIYLNNAATSWPKPEDVYRAADYTLRHLAGSPGRGHSSWSLETGQTLVETRELLATLFNIQEPEHIIFTSGATMSLNLALKGFLNPGDHVIISSMEHNSVARPLFSLRASGVEVSIAQCSPEGTLDPREVEALISPRTKLICLTHASNVTGAILPIAEVGEIARRHGVYFLVDAAQTAGELSIDVEEAHIDFLAFTGHKALFGPPGTGGLYIRHPEKLYPLIEGGTGSHSEAFTQPEIMPDKFESGTPNAPGIAALGAGVKFILKTGLERIRAHNLRLLEFLLEGLKEIPGLTLYGPGKSDSMIPVVSLNIEGISPGEACAWLAERYGIITRSGLHCAPLAHQTIGTLATGTLRLSPGFFNTEEEIEKALAGLRELVKEVRGECRSLPFLPFPPPTRP
ncbi:cysteine desulfurase family protein [Thermanaeromonas toyohensis ToBE]|uniref:cysteine desulfurase n=1 Tax=Thermanaeromonas toyohensis ToBE TaxID=698762 RepID=A0A1W1VZI1_9FIRM|nr:aminotransferase class V-fold PLP-dependent enzyme [Thermanaeromonas toyohensis]SMB98264.1 cysteine desulfurase family protein [Thermanaeromonas toyohensis ToBE]